MGAIGLVVWLYRDDLIALWREPVLRYPVLIVESDDWGAGPIAQADALGRLAGILTQFRDEHGRHPVMTVAVVLAVPDGPAIRSTGRYRRRTLGDPLFMPVRQALLEGERRGVFALQLHGMEHYWPATLMSCGDLKIRRWLTNEQPAATESLPPHLQSRWLDATVLPSRPLPAKDIEAAAIEETALFAQVLGHRAKVAVPPTFIWNQAIEAAWAKHGVEFVVTPGRRYSCRDAQGQPGCAGPIVRNAERGDGVTYLVRNDYFEPERGHAAEHGLDALQRRTGQGRPCLLETHRSNFIGGNAERACAELERLLQEALRAHPDLRFISTLELGRAFREESGSVLELAPWRRFTPWVNRVTELRRFWKLACFTGLALALRSISAITQWAPQADDRRCESTAAP